MDFRQQINMKGLYFRKFTVGVSHLNNGIWGRS